MDENSIILPHTDSILFLVITPFALLSVMFIMATFFFYPKTRQVPGDLVLAIATSDFFNLMTYLVVAGYAVQYNTPSDQFCEILGFISVMATVGNFVYNCAFCAYVYVMLSNTLKLKSGNRVLIHGICIFLILVIPIILLYFHRIGMGYEGMCFLVYDIVPYKRSIILILQLMVQLYTLKIINEKLPQHQSLLKYTEEFFRFFRRYVKIMAIICAIKILSVILDIINTNLVHSQFLQIFDTISSLSKLIEPMVLSIIRGENPIIKKKISRMKAYIINRYSRSSLLMQSEEPNMYAQLSLILKQTSIISILEGIRQCTLLEDPRQELLKRYQSHDLTRSITSRKSYERMTRSLEKKGSIEKIQQELLTTYNLTPEILLENQILTLGQTDTVLAMKVTIYAPKLFKILQDRDSVMIDPISSLDPQQNMGKPFKEPSGGRSGEFFFFSSDHRLIIKTIREDELNAFLERILNYATYLIQNNQTFLSIIYGVYSFENLDTKEITHVILQRNIAQVGSRYIQRSFDLKGSEHDREVKIKFDTNLKEVTLKDLNFIALEQTIKVNNSQEVAEILACDVDFLKSVALMDYSLLVLKVDWGQYSAENSIKIKDISRKFTLLIQMMPSSEEPGIYYHIAIIDYLQIWNAKKKFEKTGKKIIHGNVDTSATHPMDYADRFKEKLIYTIFK